MLLSLIASLSAADPQTLDLRIAEASVYRTGLVMITREADIPAGDHVYRFKQIPRALDNTLWVDSPDGAEVSDVLTQLKLEKGELTQEATTIPQYLKANVGKPIELTYMTSENKQERVAGKLMSVSAVDGYPWVTVLDDTQAIHQIMPSMILTLSAKGLDSKVKLTTMKASLQLECRVRCSKPSHLKVCSIEAGAAWNASYRIDMEGKGTEVSARAQVATSGLTFSESAIHLVTGLPNLGQGARYDLATGVASLTEWLDNSHGSQENLLGPDADPYARLAAFLVQAQQAGFAYDPATGRIWRIGSTGAFEYKAAPVTATGRAAGGQLIGGQGLVPDGIDSVSYNPTNNSLVVYGRDELKFVQQAIQAERAQDIFTYPMGRLSLQPGERLTRTLSKTPATSEDKHVWDLIFLPATSAPDVIRHVLSVRNQTKSAWPSGPAYVTKDNLPVAQVTMPFTAAGKDADIDMGTVDDIVKSHDSQEVSREPIRRRNWTTGTRVHYDVTLTVENTRAEHFTLDVGYETLGQITKADGAQITKLAKVFDKDNVATKAFWHLDLSPGEKRELHVYYQVVL